MNTNATRTNATAPAVVAHRVSALYRLTGATAWTLITRYWPLWLALTLAGMTVLAVLDFAHSTDTALAATPPVPAPSDPAGCAPCTPPVPAPADCLMFCQPAPSTPPRLDLIGAAFDFAGRHQIGAPIPAT